jgi:uncharacterized protein with HEPN domain
MQPKSVKLLEDILDAAVFIQQLTNGRTLDDYRTDRVIRQAVERNFEIIGEALRRLSKIDPSVSDQIGDHQQIIAFRNLLIHGYDIIDDAIVWRVINQDLPVLEQEVTNLLGEDDQGS